MLLLFSYSSVPLFYSEGPCRGNTDKKGWCRPQDGEHTNNYVQVVSSSNDIASVEARGRILSEAGTLTAEERSKLEHHFGVAQ